MEEGEKMTRDEMLFTYDGVVYPTALCSPEVFKALESFEARSDDIMLAGYCKSGECHLFGIKIISMIGC